MLGIKKMLSAQRGKYLKSLRMRQIEPLRKYFSATTSILSHNCTAGFLYQDLDLPYLSPTAGLYFFFPDYMRFLADLEGNLAAKLTFVTQSKYELGNERYRKHKPTYPVALLNGDLEIHFLHYASRQEAETKWYKRAERVNFKDLVIIGTELDNCTEEDIRAFEKLDYQKKFFFTRKNYNLPSQIFIKDFERDTGIGDPYKSGHILYKNLAKKIYG